MNEGNNGTSVLTAQCGTRKITRDELASIPAPASTRTHQPLAHIRIVEALAESLVFRQITVVRDEYAVSQDGMRMFGVLDLETDWFNPFAEDDEDSSTSSFRFSIGIRNSNDKTMRLGMTIGYRVFVCDNMMFAGDFAPVLRKHTSRLDLSEAISVGVDRMQRGFEPLRRRITDWQEREVGDDEARLVIYRAFVERGLASVPKHLMSAVHNHYFEPRYEAFKARTYWSLMNAFSSAFKELKPVNQFQATGRLGAFLSRTDIGSHSASDNAYGDKACLVKVA